jgi:hypothetical protein
MLIYLLRKDGAAISINGHRTTLRDGIIWAAFDAGQYRATHGTLSSNDPDLIELEPVECARCLSGLRTSAMMTRWALVINCAGPIRTEKEVDQLLESGETDRLEQNRRRKSQMGYVQECAEEWGVTEEQAENLLGLDRD